MTQEQVMERVIDQIAERCASAFFNTWKKLNEEQKDNWRRYVKSSILSIPVEGKTIKELIEGWTNGKLRELDPNQSLPDISYYDAYS